MLPFSSKAKVLFFLAFLGLCNNQLIGAVVYSPNTWNQLASDMGSATTGDTINLPTILTYNSATDNPLPPITQSYTIQPNSSVSGSAIINGNNQHRGLLILGGSATPTIQNVKFQNTRARGGSGGAASGAGGSGGGGLGAGGGIYVGDGAFPILINVTFDHCGAQGGIAGNQSPTPIGSVTAGGGGGGLGGNGGAGSFAPSGTGAGGGGGGGGYLIGENGGDGSGANGGLAGGTVGAAGATGGQGTGAVNAPNPFYGGGGGGAACLSWGTPQSGASSAGTSGYGGGGGGGGGAGWLGNLDPANCEGKDGGFGGGGGGGGAGARNSGQPSTYFGGGSLWGGGNGGDGGTGWFPSPGYTIGGRGGGGAALGGAIFVDGNSSLNYQMPSTPFTSSSLFPGGGNSSGVYEGFDIFLATGGNLTLNVPTGITVQLTNPIEADNLTNLGELRKSGGGTLDFQNLNNTYRRTTKITNGVLSISAASALGDPNNQLVLSGGTLHVYGNSFTLSQNVAVDVSSGISVASGKTLTLQGGTFTRSNFSTLQKLNPGALILNVPDASINCPLDIVEGQVVLGSLGNLNIRVPVNVHTLGILAIASGAGEKTIGWLEGTGFVYLNDNNLRIPYGNYYGNISGTGGIKKIETLITLTFSAQNSYTGPTIIESGELVLHSLGTLGNNSPLTINNSGALAITPFYSPLPTAAPLVKTIGDLQSSSSTSAILLNGNTLVVPSGSYAGQFKGSGTVRKTTDGTLNLSGSESTTTVQVDVEEGTLLLSNVSFPQMDINVMRNASVGSLGGEGTIGNVTNSGIVFPGHSINDLLVGNYTQTGSGLLQIEIAPAPNGSTVGISDRILATGVATLDGILEVKPLVDIGFYKKGTMYQVITAEGGIDGNFREIIENTPFDFTTEVIPTPPLPRGTNAPTQSETLYLIIVTEDFLLLPIDEIKSGNSRNVAKYITSCFIPEGSDFESVAEILGQLNLGQLNQAFDQMSASRFGALTWIDFRNNRTISKLLQDHLAKLYKCDRGIADCSKEQDRFCLEKKRWNVWFEPFFYYSDQDRKEHQYPYNARSFGGVVGTDYTFPSNVALGGGLGYSYSNMDWEGGLGDSHINGLYGGLYSSYYNKWGFVNLSLIGTRGFYHANRRVHFPGLDRTAVHSHKSWDLTTHFGGGLDFIIDNVFHIAPSVDLDYINIWEGSFQERNAGSISLEVDNKHSAFFRSLLAMNFLKDFRRRTSCWTPGIIAGWIHETPLTSRNLHAKMTQPTCSGTFKSATYHNDRNLALIGATLTGQQQSGFVFYFNYFFEFNGSFHQHNTSSRFEWNF